MTPTVTPARREDFRLLAGRATYLADLRIPGTAEVAFVRSPRPHALLQDIDTAEARAMPGVVAVLTADDLGHVDLVDDLQEVLAELHATPQPVLARDVVRYVGEPLAIVVAESRALAEDAAERVALRFEDLPPVPSVRVAMSPDAPALAGHGSNVVFHGSSSFGDLEAAFGAAHHVTTYELETARYAAVPLETRGAIATFDPGRGRLEFWSSTQSEFVLRRKLAAATGLRESAVRVRVPDVGGGFGQKIPMSVEEAAIALAALRIQRPLRWIEDRWENLTAAPQAKQQAVRLELAVAEDGRFLALRADVTGDIGAYSHNSASGLIEPYIGILYLPGPYTLDAYGFEVRAVLTTKSPVSPYRGTGATAVEAALELLIDRCADEVGMDRVALRARNLLTSDRFPHHTIKGSTFDSGSHAEALELLTDAADLAGFAARRQTSQARGRYRGLGVSVLVEATGRPLMGSFQASYDGARVTLEHDGGITVHASVSAQGQGHETMFAQLTAEAMGVSPGLIDVRSGDTDSAPLSTFGTRASRTAVMSGGAVHLAATELRERVLALAAALIGCPADELTVDDSGVRALAGGPALSLAAIARAALFDRDLRARLEEVPELSVTRGYDTNVVFGNAAYAVEVEVDQHLGTVVVDRITCVDDAGRIINPLIVDGQLRGAAVQGIGGALFEHSRYDEAAMMRSATLFDYRLPRSSDVPDMTIRHLSSPSPTAVHGVKGVGENGMIGVPAAIATAVSDALRPFSATVAELPITPDVVLGMVESFSSPTGVDRLLPGAGWRDSGTSDPVQVAEQGRTESRA